MEFRDVPFVPLFELTIDWPSVGTMVASNM
jgi:hypothetical protein